MTATRNDEVAELRRANAELQQRLDAALAERDEALDQQTATAQVLQVINSSPGDLAPVFQAILDNALRLCGAAFGNLLIYENGYYHAIVGVYSDARSGEQELARAPFQPAQGAALHRIINGESIIYIEDVRLEVAYHTPQPQFRELVDAGGYRSMFYISLRQEDRLLGAIVIFFTEITRVTDKQIELLRSFAAQAVIAMENARLITETRNRTRDLEESLEYQTAVGEVLKVISRSAVDLDAVLDTVVTSAVTLCRAEYAVIYRRQGDEFRWAASHGLVPEYDRIERDTPIQPGSGTLIGRVVLDGRTVLIPDAWSDPLYEAKEAARIGNVRSMLGVPLIREGAVIGAIGLARGSTEPYSEREIQLVTTFADQAVIAVENARLITETREALDQQTATAEVLGVINASPGDLAPVFQAIVEKAHTLCDAASGSLQLWDGENFRGFAMRGFSDAMAERLRLGYSPVDMPCQRIVAGESVVHCADLAEFDSPTARIGAEVGGVRTILYVALRKDDTLLGQIVAVRKEVRPFSDKEIALVENFAAQAVIAMENARLLTETQEALDQQTATAEVLQVINSSPGDLAPVFDAMLDKALRLCDANFGQLITFDGIGFRAAAWQGYQPEPDRSVTTPPTPGMALYRIIHGEEVVHVSDITADEVYRSGNPTRRRLADEFGARTAIWVALKNDAVLLGAFVIYRTEVRPFTDKQSALLQNFGAQAVVAMENARLITETREALEQQTATAEVLQVINSSPGDLTPVFDAILEKAHSLCGAAKGALTTYDGEYFRSVATRGVSEEYAVMLRASQHNSRGSPPQRLLDGESLVHVPDMSALPFPMTRAAAEREGARTALYVPLRKDGALLGYLTAFRQEVRPFGVKQIALLQNFAAQAVIAIENARLITETREALEQQTATAEVLGVINSSPGDLAPVFDAVLDKAMRLCEAAFGQLDVYEDGNFNTVSSRGMPAAWARYRLDNPPRYGPGTQPARILGGERLIHVVDLKDEEAYANGEPNRRSLVDLGGARSSLMVPLLRDDAVLGFISFYRQEVRPFTPKHIALLQNFAAQAVIAMENARLLDEIRQRQAELRVTFDNMADGVIMFDEDLRLAAWNRNFQELLDLPDAVLADRPSYADYLRVLAERGEFGTDDIEAELNRRLENADQEIRLERTRPDGRVIEVRRNSVPDGGFVLIYSDITKRKRSEAEIRAARDTAEATLRDLRAAQANLVQAEKMASLGQLTAGIAHEIKNPLNFVNNFASLSVELLDELKETTAPAVAALDESTRAEVDETMVMLTGNLEKIAEHGKRADNIVKSMLEHSRGVSGERREVDLNQLVEEALNLAYHGARAQDQTFNITLDRDYADSLKPIELAPQEITRVFLNLFGNGFYAANKRSHENGDGSFRPTLTVATRDNKDAVEVRVRDNGTGIPPEIRDKLFQPFFTTKPTGEGTGLGLSISYDIVTQQHGGTITVDSRVGEFTEFTVRLPRH